MMNNTNENTARLVIGFITVVVIGLVSWMYIHPGFQVEFDAAYPTVNKLIFPAINACLNSLVSIFLLASLYFIRDKNIKYHQVCNLIATSLSVLFLLNYVFYHNISSSTKYGGTGVLRGIYFFILVTHIFLAAAVFPFILLTLYRALSNQIEKHKKIAKWTWYVWFYVAVTGVIVYFMIKPYY